MKTSVQRSTMRRFRDALLVLALGIALALTSSPPASACWSCAWDEECLPTWTGFSECSEKVIIVQGYEIFICKEAGSQCAYGGSPGHPPPV